MAQTKDWIHAMRLRTLPLSVAGILMGSFIALSCNKWDTLVFISAIATTLLFQILSNLANDLGDTLKGADNPDRVGPTRAVQSGAISVSAMKKAVSINAILGFISAGFLIYVASNHLSQSSIYFYAFLALASILAAIMYTLGKKAYGYLGLGDLMVFLFFGVVSVIGVFPLFGGTLTIIYALPAVTIGLLSTAVLNLNNMRDIENDARVGKRTLVVKLGSSKAKVYHFFLVVGAMIAWISFLIIQKQWLGLISLIPFVLFVKHLIFVAQNTVPRAYDPHLKTIALGTFFVSVLYGLSFIF